MNDRFRTIGNITAIGVVICIFTIIAAVINYSTPSSLREVRQLVHVTSDYPGLARDPDAGAPSRVHEYSFDLPALTMGSESLAVWLVHSDVEITIADQVIFDSKSCNPGWLTKSPGCYWATVPVYQEDSGKRITIRTSEVYYGLSDRLPDIFIGSMDEVMAYCLRKEWTVIVAAILCMVLGAVFNMLTRLMRADRFERIGARYMGLFISMVGMFRLLDMPFVTLMFNGRSQLITYVSLLLFMWIPFVFCMSATFQRWGVKLYRYWSLYFAAINVAFLIMQILRIRDLRQNVAFIYLSLIVYFITILVQIIVNKVRRTHVDRYHWIPAIYLLIGAGLVADLVLYSVLGHTRQSNISLYITLVYGFLSGASMIAGVLNQQEEYRLKELELSDQRGTMMLSQIRPHFIYNTMNTIYSLCDVNVETAKEAIHDFSGYLRLNFESMDHKTPIDFVQELQHARFYLSIEKLRFGDDLDVIYDIGCDDFMIPPLTLQPMAENAVRHGIRGKTGKGTVTIRTREEDDHYEVIVEDDGVGFDVRILDSDDMEGPGGHVAIRNVSARVEQMCGGKLLVESKAGSGTKVTIIIPKTDRR